MSTRNTLRNPAMLFRIGMLALLLGIALMWGDRATAALPSGLLDGVRGLLAGISIGCLLLAMRLRHRGSSSDKPRA
jgi:hypothetical protein